MARTPLTVRKAFLSHVTGAQVRMRCLNPGRHPRMGAQTRAVDGEPGRTAWRCDYAGQDQRICAGRAAVVVCLRFEGTKYSGRLGA
jgi:hypothetical protein